MSNSAEGSSGSNGVSVEAGELSPEDAERFAAELKPSWEFDDAPFQAHGAGPNEDLHALGNLANGGINDDVAAALKMDMSRTAPATATAPGRFSDAPGGGITRPSAQDQYSQQARAPHGAIQVSSATPQPHRPIVVRPPARSSSSSVARGPSSTRDDLRAIKKNNKGLLFAAIGVAGGLALIFGIRAATSSDDSTAVSTQAASTTPASRQEEPRIPPPPPPSDPTTPATALDHAPTAATAATTPEPATPHPTPAAQPAVPPAPRGETAKATPPEPRTPRVAPSPLARPTERPPTHSPVAPPKPPPAKTPGGIVRDNPF